MLYTFAYERDTQDHGNVQVVLFKLFILSQSIVLLIIVNMPSAYCTFEKIFTWLDFYPKGGALRLALSVDNFL